MDCVAEDLTGEEEGSCRRKSLLWGRERSGIIKYRLVSSGQITVNQEERKKTMLRVGNRILKSSVYLSVNPTD